MLKRLYLDWLEIKMWFTLANLWLLSLTKDEYAVEQYNRAKIMYRRTMRQ